MLQSGDPNNQADRSALDTRLRLLLSGILLAAYMLVYIGVPASIDGSATLAVASSVLTHGTPDIAVLGSAEALLPPLARMGSFGPDGVLYAKKGVTPSLLLLPLVGLAEIVPFLPVRATALLLNPIITTLTALLLYTFARRLNFRPRTAFIGGLLYGVGTFAIIYTTTLFGEPVAALLLLVAVMESWHYRQQRNLRALLFAGGALGLALGVNLTYVVMVPLIGLYAFGVDPRRWRVAHLARMIAPFALIVALLLLYNLARFGSLFQSGYNFAEGEGFTSPFWLGVFGLLVSPYRGMLWYNPVVLLAIPGAIMLRRQQPRLIWIVLAVTAAQIVTYASWWSWHGGVVWGPRFLLPVTPLVVVLILPVIDRIPQQRLLTGAFVLLGGLSLAIQMVASLFSFIPHIIYLYENFASNVVDGFFIDFDREIIFRVDLSPVLAQFRLAFAGSDARPVLLKHGDMIHALLVIALLGIGLLAFHYAKRRVGTALTLVAMTAAILGVASRQIAPTEAARAVMEELTPADMVIAASTRYDDNLLDAKRPARIVTTNAPTAPDDPLTSGLWRYAMQQHGLTWFITWFPPASDENWQERDLWQHASFVRETIFREDRALLFDLNAPAQSDQPGGWQFGPIEMAGYGIRHDPDGVRVSLQWQSDDPPSYNATWFVHLVDASGQIVQQQDRAPQGGYTPTSMWTAGEPVEDYLFFPLPADTATDGWQLRIGWIQPESGDRLPVTEPDGTSLADGYILLPVP